MKRKKTDIGKLLEEIRKANKCPKFVKAVKEFIRYHGGDSDSY